MPEVPRLLIKFTDIFQMIEEDGSITYIKLLVNPDGSLKVDRESAEADIRAESNTQSFPTLTDNRGFSEEPTQKFPHSPVQAIPSLSAEGNSVG